MDILIAVIGSGSLGILITKIFDLISERNKLKAKQKEDLEKVHKELSDIKAAVKLNEKDNLRTQLMVMIKDYPYETTDILRLGEHYFKVLNGNWVLTDIFGSWAAGQGVILPNWFPGEEKKNEQ